MLNVKDPEAYRLARAISQATGETMTRVVIEALRSRFDQMEKLQRRDPEKIAAEMRAIARRASALIRGPFVDHADFLYDEHGLPK